MIDGCLLLAFRKFIRLEKHCMNNFSKFGIPEGLSLWGYVLYSQSFPLPTHNMGLMPSNVTMADANHQPANVLTLAQLYPSCEGFTLPHMSMYTGTLLGLPLNAIHRLYIDSM